MATPLTAAVRTAVMAPASSTARGKPVRASLRMVVALMAGEEPAAWAVQRATDSAVEADHYDRALTLLDAFLDHPELTARDRSQRR